MFEMEDGADFQHRKKPMVHKSKLAEKRWQTNENRIAEICISEAKTTLHDVLILLFTKPQMVKVSSWS